MSRKRLSRSERGYVMIITAAFLIVLCPVIGLAIDVGMMFVIKAKLSSAVDAAALGAARGLTPGSDATQAINGAKAAGRQYFLANYPADFMNSNTRNLPSDAPDFNVDAQQLPDGRLQVTVSANVNAPTYFLRTLNLGNNTLDKVTVGSKGQATRKLLVMVLVLDTSASMGSGAGSACDIMTQSAAEFIRKFTPYDYISVVTFDSQANLRYLAPSTGTDIAGIAELVSGLDCPGSTNTSAALYMAREILRSYDFPLAANTIVFFTDGVPNGTTAFFPIRATAGDPLGTRHGPDMNYKPLIDRYALSGPPATRTKKPFANVGCQLQDDDCGVTKVDGVTGTMPDVFPGCEVYSKQVVYGAVSRNQGNPEGTTSGIAFNPLNPDYYPKGAAKNQSTFMWGATGNIHESIIDNTGTVSDKGSVNWPKNCGPSELGRFKTNLPTPINAGQAARLPGTSYDPNDDSDAVREFLDYIPDVDAWGFSTHQPVNPRTNKPAVGMSDDWILNTNSQCNSDQSRCIWIGADWSTVKASNDPYKAKYFDKGDGQNYINVFRPASDPRSAHFRIDQPNTLVLTGMQAAVNLAIDIQTTKSRQNPNSSLNISIYSIYLIGNESVANNYFLPYISNVKEFVPIDPFNLSQRGDFPDNNAALLQNDLYNPNAKPGRYLATADRSALQGLFLEIASSLLRLSE